MLTCYCGSSNVKPYGWRGSKRDYKCCECGKRFTREQRYNKLDRTSPKYINNPIPGYFMPGIYCNQK